MLAITDKHDYAMNILFKIVFFFFSYEFVLMKTIILFHRNYPRTHIQLKKIRKVTLTK